MRRAIEWADRALWATLGAVVAVSGLLVAAASPRDEVPRPEVAAYADLVVELVRRIDAAGGGEAVERLLERIDACDDDAARWADRALRAEAAVEDLFAAVARESDAAHAWAMRAGEAEASLRAARRGDLDGDGVADGNDLGIVLLAIAGDLPEEPRHPWWWEQVLQRGEVEGAP